MGVVKEVAEEALGLTYDDLPEQDVHQIKRLLLDTLACAYGGRDNETVEVMRRSLTLLGGSPQAQIWGDADQTSVLNATLINGAMVRYLDMNDVQYSDRDPMFRGGHNSELFPPVLALSELVGASGRDFIRTSWLGYELATRYVEAIEGRTLEQRGWNLDSRASFIYPLVSGLLLGLDATQIEHAVGISLSRGMLFQVIDHSAEVNSMAKNLRAPLGAHLGVIAAYLASQGLTGPMRALEGGGGVNETALDGDFNLDHFRNVGWRSRVLLAGTKKFAACYAQHGHLSATLELVLRHDLKPADIEKIDIRTTTRGASHTGDPSRRHPTNKETADHSSYYVQAALIRDRELGPAQYTEAKLNDEEIHRLADAVSIEGDPEFDNVYPSARVTLTLRDGSTVEQYIADPPGSPRNPMTDDDIEAKFRSLARPTLSESAIDECIDAVWRLDEFDDMKAFAALLASR